MKEIIYALATLAGLFLTFGESSTATTNIIGIVILFAVAIKTNVIDIKDFFKK